MAAWWVPVEEGMTVASPLCALSIGNLRMLPPSGQQGMSMPALLLLAFMLLTAFPSCWMDPADDVGIQDAARHVVGSAGHCGEYSNQLLPDGQCHVFATLVRADRQSCQDAFRCTDEASYWLREIEERKQQVLALKETMSELQEELRSHRHRVKVLELQSEEKSGVSALLERCVRRLERHSVETSALLQLHASLARDVHARLHNLSALAERARRSPGCTVDTVRSSALLITREIPPPASLPQMQHISRGPTDCASIYTSGARRSGVYTVAAGVGAIPVQVFCDMDTAGGGWIVIQRRQDGSVSFSRSWEEYKEGFGELHGEFWLGNEHIHQLTSRGHYTLRIDLEDWSDKHKHATYDSFSIDEEASKYRLHVAGFSGTAGDSFSWYHNLHGFSTPDTDNVCASIARGGWWYHQCFFSNLNGLYYKGGRYSPRGKSPLGPDGIVWFTWKNSDYYSLRKVRMMLRPRTFPSRPSP